MNITASVKKNDVNYRAVLDAIAFLKKHEVCIGIPENTANRNDEKGTPINNAELLFIHTNGSPAKKIPPRPVLKPAIEKNHEQISVQLKKAVDAAVQGRQRDILPALKMAGTEGQNAARDYFTDPTNEWAPNKPETVKRKRDSTRPLIDTDEMRKSITYVVREVGK